VLGRRAEPRANVNSNNAKRAETAACPPWIGRHRPKATLPPPKHGLPPAQDGQLKYEGPRPPLPDALGSVDINEARLCKTPVTWPHRGQYASAIRIQIPQQSPTRYYEASGSKPPKCPLSRAYIQNRHRAFVGTSGSTAAEKPAPYQPDIGRADADRHRSRAASAQLAHFPRARLTVAFACQPAILALDYRRDAWDQDGGGPIKVTPQVGSVRAQKPMALDFGPAGNRPIINRSGICELTAKTV